MRGPLAREKDENKRRGGEKCPVREQTPRRFSADTMITTAQVKERTFAILAKNDVAGGRQAGLWRCPVGAPCGGCVASVATAVPLESATEVDVIGRCVVRASFLYNCKTAQRTLGI
jgi:hypothetical protein